jgi:hypothetical protein
MPAILPKYNVNDRLLNDLTASEFQARKTQIDLYWNYYNGAHHKPLKIRQGEYDDNIIINLCGRSADKLTEFIGIPNRLDLPGDVDGDEDSPQQMLLNEAVQAHEPDIPQVFIAGMVTGHVFLKINQEDDGATWRLDLIDGRHIIVFWDTTNVRRKLYYRMEWQMGNEKRRVDMVPDWLLDASEAEGEVMPVPGVPERWTVIEYQMKGSSSRWEEIARDEWAFSFAPIVDWANKRVPHQYYGASNLKNAIPLNDAVNFVASNTGRIIKYHAHPRTIGLGMEASDVKGTSIDGLLTISAKPGDAEISNLEMQSDLSSSMAFFNQLKGEFFAEQRMVDLSTIRDRLGQVTNFGVRMIFNEQLENSDEKRRVYGQWLSRAFQRLLTVMAMEVEEPEAQWDDPLPTNRMEAVQTAQIENDLGVSKQTLFDDLGRDYFKEQERRADEGVAGQDGLISALDRFGQVGGAQELFPAA